MQYSVDGGSTWTNILSGSTTTAAQSIKFRGTGGNTLYIEDYPANNKWTVTGGTFDCTGDWLTLLNYQNPPTQFGDYTFYGMFYGTQVQTVPEFPNIPLGYASFGNMFAASAITASPALPWTTVTADCYNSMFSGATALTNAGVPALPATNLTGAAACYAYMLESTNITIPPSLPATTLANRCYNFMFGFTKLTTLPLLPAINLTQQCYQQMFYQVSTLTINIASSTGYTTAYRIPTSGTGVTNTNSLDNMFYNTSGTRPVTPSINTTYYTNNTPV